MNADPSALAMQAVAFLSDVGTSAAGSALWDWLKAHIGKRPNSDALAKLEREQGNEVAKLQVQAVLLEALQEDESFRRELAERLDQPGIRDVRQTIVNIGGGARNTQVVGSGNEVTVE